MSREPNSDRSGSRTRRRDSGGYEPRNPYSGPYDQQGGYDEPDDYSPRDPYGAQRQYGDYGARDQYGQAGPYGAQDPYSQTDPNGGQDSYGRRGRYEGPEPDYYPGDAAYSRDEYPGQAGYPGYGGYDRQAEYPGEDGYRPAQYGERDYYGQPDSAGYDTGRGYGQGDSYDAGYRGAEEVDSYPGQGQHGRTDDYGDYAEAAGSGQHRYASADPYGQVPDADGSFGWQERGDERAGASGRGARSRHGARHDRAADYEDAAASPGDVRSRARQAPADPDDRRHDAFFRGFGRDDDDLGRSRPKKRGRGGMAALVALIVILGVVGGGGYYAYSWYAKRHASYTGTGSGSVTVVVKQGATGDSLAPELVKLGVVGSVDSFAAYVQNKTGLQPGEYRLHLHMGDAQAWAMLTNPKNAIESKVTIPDGVRYSKFLPELAKESGIPLSKFQAAIKDTAALGLPAYAHGNPEGFLFPDTYDVVPGTTTALQILQTAVKQFKIEAGQLNLAAAAQKAEFSEADVIIEASLLEAEVGPQYYKDVARVIDNRLNLDMNLNLDSTVAYATGKYIYDLTSSDLNVNSPYNTFKHLNLPPGPIDSPDVAAIEAVLHPAPQSDNWIYFVTVNKKGLTLFTDSQTQFDQWSAEAQKNGL